MKSITWKVVLTDDNRIVTFEEAISLPQDAIETHLTIIGVLENLKQKHLNKLNTLFERTVKDKDDPKL